MSDKKKDQGRIPEWAPQQADSKFATRIVPGVKDNVSVKETQPKDRHHNPKYDLDYLHKGILASDRTVLAKAITLIESNSPKHFSQAQELVKLLIPHSGKSIRIGITGVPGAGKSTFIETLGTWLIEQGHKVTVLAIDPSSTISKGSILGDKTRMEKLSRSESSFIRPSPSSGVLGGVARKTRETIIACEAAGYDVILIETVGVGQSEVTVRSIVDFFLLLQITGAGDDLQGIKKGIMELADLIAVNKADGENLTKAQSNAADIKQVLHYLQPATKGWTTTAVTCSALTGDNIPAIWQLINEFVKLTKASGAFEKRRTEQNMQWLDAMLTEALSNMFFSNKDLAEQYQIARQKVLSGEITPAIATNELIEFFKKQCLGQGLG
ncbi:MAG: methylmalonyl Co-A mutase-associated GTPase MeaB [Candidatus Cloacimonadaceae bacterium]